MREYEIAFKVRVCSVAELDARDAELIDAAMRATETSYSPYSHFEVGAAIRLESGEIVVGSNQENASYPVGCCAERTALFWCGANRRDEVIEALAIAARTGGMCRQALIEVEHKQGSPIRLLLYGTKGVHIVESIESIVPFSFYSDSLSL